jgi:hypothetical protein
VPYGLTGWAGQSRGDAVAPGNGALTQVEERQVPWEGAPSVWTEPKASLRAGSLP